MSTNEETAKVLHTPVIKKFKRRKVYARKKNIKYLLFILDVFTKYAWVKPWKYRKSKRDLNDFVEIVSESNCKANNIWVD